MGPEPELFAWVAGWLIATGAVFYTHRKVGAGTGLVLAYVLQLWALHWLAAAIYLLPWYWNLHPRIVLAGLQQGTYAVLGFLVGSLAVPFLLRHRGLIAAPTRVQLVPPALLRLLLLVGSVSYFVLLPGMAQIPTASALVAGAGNVLVLGLGLKCWNSSLHGNKGRLWCWLSLSALLPFTTVILQGFLGYGFAAMVTVFAFVASFHRPRWHVLLLAALVGYSSLSIYVTYMRDRQEIRDIVWAQEPMGARFERLRDTFSEPELFDITNVAHLQRIDQRLNQNYLVGSAVAFLQPRAELFAGGETIWQAVLAPIPRALWPNKPFIAGSGDLVSRFTGIRFADGTSVGIGQVMELYVNFDSPGVFLGFILIGAILVYVDRTAAYYLHRGNWPRFTVWFLPGVSMLQVGGSLGEVSSSAAAALVVALAINQLGTHRTRSVAASSLTPHWQANERRQASVRKVAWKRQ